MQEGNRKEGDLLCSKQPSRVEKIDRMRSLLRSCPFIMAPMIDQSELAFRMLCRKYTPNLICYTPMFFSHLLAEDQTYYDQEVTTCPGDKPLIVQICGNDPDVMLRAAQKVQHMCDAVDINLGCPLKHAKENLYGSYLLDRQYWPLVCKIVNMLSNGINIPVCCKIRLLSTVEETIEFAKLLESSGCHMLAVHGRTRLNQRRKRYGPADWDAIKRIKSSVEIPVISNGNILNFSDLATCLDYTKADGVMSAESLLENPLLFSGQVPIKADIISEYLRFADEYSAPFVSRRDHVKNILRKELESHPDLQSMIKSAAKMETLGLVIQLLVERQKSGISYGDVRRAERREESRNDVEESTFLGSMF
eukprot:TRINITY_DN4600_c0_g1_i4.p1 TRINITY_DN4600_c0_g1~~TRINITY_DN4600_c0_g1_i4.p1  ORF type:complete len:363 (+),score=47.38 TRINITY_DN4600_c0_g1_i4:89-1177(+)